MQAAVEITHTLHDILHFVLVLGLDLARLANGNVQGELNGALAAGHPARGRDVGFGQEADPVLAGVGGGEGEAAGVVFALVHDAVVVVEGLVDGDLDLEVVVDRVGVGVGVDDFGFELACSAENELVTSRSCPFSFKFVVALRRSPYLLPGCPWGDPRRSTLVGGHQCRSTGR